MTIKSVRKTRPLSQICNYITNISVISNAENSSRLSRMKRTNEMENLIETFVDLLRQISPGASLVTVLLFDSHYHAS